MMTKFASSMLQNIKDCVMLEMVRKKGACQEIMPSLVNGRNPAITQFLQFSCQDEWFQGKERNLGILMKELESVSVFLTCNFYFNYLSISCAHCTCAAVRCTI